MASEPDRRLPSDVPKDVLAGAAHDEQLRAAARSWSHLPELTQDRMLKRAKRLLNAETADQSQETHPPGVDRTSTRLRRLAGLPAQVDDAAGLPASGRKRQASASGRSRLSAIERVPPGRERQAANRRLLVVLAVIGLVALAGGLAVWWAAQPPAIPTPNGGR